jgi:glycosyltransferase involved in cell wall biosynthesis
VEVIKQSAMQMPKIGHTIEVVTLNDAGAPWLKNFPAKVHALGEISNGYRYSSQLLPWLRKHANKYDAVIVDGLWRYPSFAVWLALRKSNIPYFVFTHGMLDPWFKLKYPLKHLKKWFYWPWAEYRVLRDAQAVFFTCEEERILARQSFWLYQCKEIVVGLGIAAPSGNPDFQRENFLQANPVLRGKRLLLFLSRIHEKKGCDILIEAFSRVASSDPLLHLVMAGPDQAGWKHQLVEQSNRLGIGNRISWPGMLSGDMKWGAYRAAEAFVLPSHQENFGIVVAEALACSVPVLISNKVNIWREINTDGAGLVEEDSVDGTIRLLQNWLVLPDSEKQRMRQAAARCFSHNYEVQMAANHLLKAIQENVTEGTKRRDNRVVP